MIPFLFALQTCLVGLTSTGKPIPCIAGGDKIHVVVVSGLDGSSAATGFLTDEARRARVTVVPVSNPEKSPMRFPPSGDAYAKDTESHYLWRWLIVHAPDMVVIAGPDPDGLAKALARETQFPVASLDAGDARALRKILGRRVPESPARREMRSQLARTPLEVARQLSVPYGHELPEAVYIPAFALIGRIRLGDTADVERIVAPYREGVKNSLEKPTASHFSGHLVFAELASRTGNRRYTEMVKAAADFGFDANGQPKESMPLHNEMSDGVFMSCPILAAAGKLTGDPKYFDMAQRHLRFMQKLDLRADGLYRHSPLDEAAWGRGNAFPALGLALTLSYMPRNHPAFGDILRSFQAHMSALAKHVDSTGMWRQVVDYPGVYPELSATSMIATAMLRGIRKGWLPKRVYQPIVDRAWEAVKMRTASDGRLIDVCTSTGKQKSLREYLDRVAILGQDPRGGAMALLFATEMAGLE